MVVAQIVLKDVSGGIGINRIYWEKRLDLNTKSNLFLIQYRE